MTNRMKWSDLTTAQRAAVIGGVAIEAAVTAWAARDLQGRTANQVRGPKAAWRAAFLVQPFGPLAYLALGRR